ncbi:hypothetical protein J2S46_000277 [Kitasatospora herbaricolor]|nr:hypothetical protein [Kitasatospora herbaricolor]
MRPLDPSGKVTAYTEMHVAKRVHRQAPPPDGESIWFVQP